MKDTEIHLGLSKQVGRDMFAELLVDEYTSAKSEKKEEPSYSDFSGKLRGFKYNLETAKVKLFNDGLEVARLEKLIATHTILETIGWEEFDVSDHVTVSYNTLCRPFLGTQEEYKAFMKANNFEE
jgi:hypothetical protein